MSELIASAYRAALGWLALGNERIVTPHGWMARNRATPRVRDANFAAELRAESPAEIDEVLGEIERAFDGFEHRCVRWDPATPAPLEARLALDGWRVRSDILTLVLEGPLRARAATAAAIEIRPATTPADWQALEDLHWLDHQEEVDKKLRDPLDRELTGQLVATKLGKAPAVQYFIARVDGTDCGFFSSWPGTEGLGIVEDLYTRPEFRGRGVATALIATCIADARRRGASAILIEAMADDTPKHIYAGMGFRPLCVQRSYLKKLA
jgi:GNAT superfamily N-acetyltransferase